MKYKVLYDKKVVKSISKIDKVQQKIIVSWIEKNLENTENPRQRGKSLKGELKDYWRYRVGNYRIIAEIDDENIKIIIFRIASRKEVYDM